MAPRDAERPARSGHALAEAAAVYGIERVPVDYFHWNGFRYTTLKDAMAAAKRAKGGGDA